MFLKFTNHHVKQMLISVGTEYKILLSAYLPEKDSDLNVNLFDPRLSILNNASHILKRKHFVGGSGSRHLLSNTG